MTALGKQSGADPLDTGRVGFAETGSRADASSRQGVSTEGFDPARVGGVTAPNYDPFYEASLMLPRLTEAQRDFIMRAKPHRRDQRLTKADWDAVECSVELMDYPPYNIWFGGMRAISGAGRKGWTRTFRFNVAGLMLRNAVAEGVELGK
jgi:hypothetical protein